MPGFRAKGRRVNAERCKRLALRCVDPRGAATEGHGGFNVRAILRQLPSLLTLHHGSHQSRLRYCRSEEISS